MTTRAKFYVESKTEIKDGFKVNLRAVSAIGDENEKFFKYTPSGSLELGLVQKETADKFTVGKEYYLDFTEVE